MITVLLQYFKKFKTRIDPTMLYRLIAVAILIIIISAVLIFRIEPEGQFNRISDAVWWAVVTATTVGYGDFYPVTTGGRVIAGILMITGIGLFGGITATLTDLFIKIEKRRELGQLEANYEGHILICGWCHKTKEIIVQILNENMKNKQIVLIADLERDPFPDNNLVHFVRGKIDDQETLEKANVGKAVTAIILNEDNNDATTVLSALTINSLNPDLYSIAEISREENAIHLENAGVDEIVVNNDINSRLMVRTALYHGTSIIFNELLSNKVGNEIYMKEAEETDISRKYIDVFNIFKKESNVTLLGLKRGQQVLLNPDNDEVISKGDLLIYISSEKLMS